MRLPCNNLINKMEEKKKNGHAIMISVPFEGHINPFVNLALNLASKGITITFVHLESVELERHSSGVDLFSDAGLDIRYTTIGDGFPLEFDRDVNIQEYWISLFYDFPARVDEFVGQIIRSDPDPGSVYFLVTDTVYGWQAAVADKYKLVNVCVWTQPALVLTVAWHRELMLQKGHLPTKDNEEIEIDYIPGVESISTRDLMPAYRQLDHIMTKIFFTAMNQSKKAHFILHNTVDELESDTLSALNKHQPHYAIGPLNFSRTNRSFVSKSLRAESDCTQWLDSKSPGSVLYISFGSIARPSQHVIQEIAYGLLLSNVDFIWVVRDCMASFLPSGFEGETKGKGLIVPWCDQILILSNLGTGGFLTHCGWNSIVESIWCGVPMVCYPFSYDQPTNRKLVVNDWKIGINLCEGASLIDRKEVGEKIKSVMGGVNSEKLRQEAKVLRQTLHNALEIHGSSKINFDQFMEDLEKKLFQQ